MDPREKREDETWAEYGARIASMGIAPGVAAVPLAAGIRRPGRRGPRTLTPEQIAVRDANRLKVENQQLSRNIARSDAAYAREVPTKGVPLQEALAETPEEKARRVQAEKTQALSARKGTGVVKAIAPFAKAVPFAGGLYEALRSEPVGAADITEGTIPGDFRVTQAYPSMDYQQIYNLDTLEPTQPITSTGDEGFTPGYWEDGVWNPGGKQRATDYFMTPFQEIIGTGDIQSDEPDYGMGGGIDRFGRTRAGPDLPQGYDLSGQIPSQAGRMTGMPVAVDAGGAVGGYPTMDADYGTMATEEFDYVPSVPADPTGGMIDADALVGMFDVGPMSMAQVGTNAFGIPDRTYGPTTDYSQVLADAGMAEVDFDPYRGIGTGGGTVDFTHPPSGGLGTTTTVDLLPIAAMTLPVGPALSVAGKGYSALARSLAAKGGYDPTKRGFLGTSLAAILAAAGVKSAGKGATKAGQELVELLWDEAGIMGPMAAKVGAKIGGNVMTAAQAAKIMGSSNPLRAYAQHIGKAKGVAVLPGSMAAATELQNQGINISAEDIDEMTSQVDTFKDIPAAPAKPAGPTPAEIAAANAASRASTRAAQKAAAAAQRKADLAEQKAAARRTALARQALKDSQAAAARAQAASEKQAAKAIAKARATLADAANRDRGGPSQRQINAAREVLSQIDTFDSGGMRNTRGEVGMDETGYTDTSGYGVG